MEGKEKKSEKRKALWETVKNMGGEKWILLALAGVLFVLAAIPTTKTSKKEQNQELQMPDQQKEETYAVELEEKLKRILEQMDGVGKAEVMITWKSSKEKVIDKNIEQSENALTEQDKEGGTRISKEMQRKEDTVLVGNSSGGEPYVIKEMNPAIEGVVVLVDGADSPLVVTEINEAVQALFNISPHKIKVLKRKI